MSSDALERAREEQQLRKRGPGIGSVSIHHINQSIHTNSYNHSIFHTIQTISHPSAVTLATGAKLTPEQEAEVSHVLYHTYVLNTHNAACSCRDSGQAKWAGSCHER